MREDYQSRPESLQVTVEGSERYIKQISTQSIERQEESTTTVYSERLSSKQSTAKESENQACGLGQRHVQKLVQDELVPAQRWHDEPRRLRRTLEVHYQQHRKGRIVATTAVHSRTVSLSIYVLLALLVRIIILAF